MPRPRSPRAVRAVGVPILVGAILDGPGPTTPQRRHPVVADDRAPGRLVRQAAPGALRRVHPAAQLARKVSSTVEPASSGTWSPGRGNGLLTGGPFPIGDVICFEVAYDGAGASPRSQAGAQLLVVQTNNATFGHTAETYQQLAMSRLRAVEHRPHRRSGRRPRGVSAVIGPDGGHAATSRRAVHAADILVATVPLRTTDTLAPARRDP